MTLPNRKRFLYAFCFLFSSFASAQAPQAINSGLNATLEEFLRVQTQGLPGKVTYRVTPLNARTSLAPCDAYEVFLPPGSKLWGKATLGIRCLNPSSWTIYTQVQVNISGEYLVAAQNLSAGSVINSGDLNQRNGELSRLPNSVLTDPNQAIGKTLKSGLTMGQAVRGDQLLAPWSVQQGQTVKTIVNGAGFSVSSEGKALNNAQEGQIVQVRTPSGQTLSGIARPGGIVEVSH